MIFVGIIATLFAETIQLAQAAGQSIQQWINSPVGQQFIQNRIRQVGQEGLQRILKKQGID